MKSIKTIVIGVIGLSLFSFSSCAKTLPFSNITPNEALNLLGNSKGTVLIDVRTPDEYKVVHIPKSILIPESEIKEKIADVIPDKQATIIVYCQTGKRSAQAAKTLASLGYKRVFNLGGIINWPFKTESGSK
ncbi:MAG: rhodanese-like domain-containing protein [Clostridia bacterium]|nr:rhodanese-like domain-containing protein [Clostridia bacterium]